MIKNIIFDIGMVLVDFNPKQVIESLGIFGEEAETILDASICSALWAELDRGVLPEGEVIAQMRENVPEALREKYDRCIVGGKPILAKMYPYAEDWVRGMRERGFGVYILSNYPVSYFEMHKSGFPFLQYADGQVVSAYVKLLKPDPEIYRCLLNKYGLKAEECIFIDDLARNVAGAESVGIHGIQFTSYEEVNRRIEEIIQSVE